MDSHLEEATLRQSWIQFESLYLDLRQAETGKQVRDILALTRFVSGEDCLLHYAATQGERWTLEYLIDYMNVRDINLDIEDSQHRTALEFAIGAGQKGAVELLLDSGASIQRWNSSDQQPLHYAIQVSSSDICMVLLQHGANVNAPLPQTRHTYCSSIAITMERLARTQAKQERDDLARIFEVLLTYGAVITQSSGDTEPTRLDFLQSWYEWDPLSFHPSHYLRSDFHPLCWFSREYCPGRECTSLAAFVFCHTPGSGLAELLVQTTDVEKYGHDLLHAILSPCARRITTEADSAIYELFQELLKRMGAQGVVPREDQFILQRIPGQAPDREKLHLVEIAHQWGLITVSESREFLRKLSPLDGDFGLQLAELLLARQQLAPSQTWIDLMGHYYTASGMFRRSSVSSITSASHHEVRSRTMATLGFGSEGPSELDDHILRNAVHVWTKRLLGGETFGHTVSAQQRVFGVAQLRGLFSLPELPVSSGMIMEMFPHINQQLRLEGSSTTPGDSAYYSSPGTTFGDLPDAGVQAVSQDQSLH